MKAGRAAGHSGDAADARDDPARHARPLNAPLDPVGETYFECFAALAVEWIQAEVKLLLPASTDAQVAAIAEHTRRAIADVTLGEVCRTAGMAERSLRRKFGAELGMTWEEFRRRQRLLHAIEALDTTDKSWV